MWGRKQKAERKRSQARMAFERARAAYERGRKVFQYIEVLTETTGDVIPMVGAYTSDEHGPLGWQSALGADAKATEPAIEQIERAGWRLEDAGYVFQQTGSVSRDKLLASGQQAAVSGRVLGVYTFRRAANDE